MAAPRVLVVGDVLLDVFFELDTAPHAATGYDRAHRAVAGDDPGRTLIHARSHQAALGGSAARTAQALAAFDCRVELVACVGVDPLGDALITALARVGVDTSSLVRVDGAASGITTAMTTADGGRAITIARGANDALATVHLQELGGADWVHVSGYLLRTAAGCKLARLLAARTRAAGIPLSLDPGAPGGATIAATVGALLPAVAWLTPNLREAVWLSGRDTAPEAAAALRAAGVDRVAVTCGSDGAVIADATGTTTVAAPRVAAGETTGAGDAFNGGLIAATLGGLDPVAAAVVACACGALVVSGQRPGPATAIEELVGRISIDHCPAHESALAWLRTVRC